jgi:hypothetical protein
MADPVTIRSFRPGDEQGLLDAYNKVFVTPDGRIPPRSMAHWKWKYADNPTGLWQIVVAEHEQHGIVGSYASIPLHLWVNGENRHCAQGGDLFVLPEWRRHGPRPGLFVSLGNRHHEMFSGREPNKYLFTYGWPIPNWRISQKYLNYENIRDWDFLFRQIAPHGIAERSSPAGLEVREVERYGADVDALWARERASITMAITRDSRYLNWRYADCPDRDYRLYECRDRTSGALRGVFVQGLCDFLFPRASFIVDWLCPIADDDAMVAMVAAAERQAVRDGANVLATLFPQLDPRFLKFQHLDFKVYGTPYFLVVAQPVAFDTIFYREQWYHTCGDSDLV